MLPFHLFSCWKRDLIPFLTSISRKIRNRMRKKLGHKRTCVVSDTTSFVQMHILIDSIINFLLNKEILVSLQQGQQCLSVLVFGLVLPFIKDVE